MDKTLASMFTGFALADEGAKQAGLTHTWGVEYDAALAAVATDNGFDTMVADVREVDYSTLATPYWLHTSPPCTTASVANADGGETELDGELSAAVIRAIRALHPRRFSLENVIGYRNYDAYRAILAALSDEGYAFDWWHLNAADYGVPQTRRRLILVASLDHRPRKPAPTHQEAGEDAGQLTLFDPLPAWRGWLPALQGEYGGRDLLPELPESKLANWQLKRLPEAWREGSRAILVEKDGAGDDRPLILRQGHEPIWTIRASPRAANMANAVLVGGQLNDRSDVAQVGVEAISLLPMMGGVAVGAKNLIPLTVSSLDALQDVVVIGGASEVGTLLGASAVLVMNLKAANIAHAASSANAAHQGEDFTFYAPCRASVLHRAFGVGDLIGDGAPSAASVTQGIVSGRSIGTIALPTRQVLASLTGTQWSLAGVLAHGSSGRVVTTTLYVMGATSTTVTTSHNHRDIRGVVGVRVVKMTPEALARFQSLYDYKLPPKAGLAVKGIGNAVPPLMAKRIFESNL